MTTLLVRGTEPFVKYDLTNARACWQRAARSGSRSAASGGPRDLLGWQRSGSAAPS
jgi:hypothetical protein